MSLTGLSRTTLLRLADARRRLDMSIDPVLASSLPNQPLNLSTLRSAIGAVVGDDLARLKRLFEDLSEDESRAERLGFGIDPSLKVNAYARSPAPASDHLFVSAGAALAIEELLLGAFGKLDFFIFDELYDPADDSRSLAPINVIDVTTEGPDRYYDYTWLERTQSSDSLLTTLPSTPWRLCQFELMRELSLQWLCLHEAAHWLAGHVDLLERFSRRRPAPRGASAISLSIGDPGFGDEAPDDKVLLAAIEAATAVGGGATTSLDFRKALELQADQLGFQLLIRLQGSDHATADNAFERYRDSMARLDLPPEFAAVIDLSPAQRLRAMTVAAGAVILIIEKAARVRGRNSHYPPPLARLLAIQLAATTATPFTETDGDYAIIKADVVTDEAFRPYMRDAFGRPFLDFNILAGLLGLESFVSVDTSRPEPQFAPTTRDLFSFFNSNATSDTFETEGGRELFAFLGNVIDVSELCADYRRLGKLQIPPG